MLVRRTAATALLALSAGMSVAAAGPALAACDAYSGKCVEETGVGGTGTGSGTGSGTGTTTGTRTDAGTGTGTGTGQASSGATLPFTGGELVLLTTLGAGALAGGTALVVAGRRRTAPVA